MRNRLDTYCHRGSDGRAGAATSLGPWDPGGPEDGLVPNLGAVWATLRMKFGHFPKLGRNELIWLVVWNIFYVPMYLECDHPS